MDLRARLGLAREGRVRAVAVHELLGEARDGELLGGLDELRDADADARVRGLQDVAPVPVVRRDLVVEERLGALDLLRIDERPFVHRALRLVREAERVLEDHVRAAGLRVALLRDRAVAPPVTEVAEPHHVLGVALPGGRRRALVELDRREAVRGAIAVDERDHVAARLGHRQRRPRPLDDGRRVLRQRRPPIRSSAGPGRRPLVTELPRAPVGRRAPRRPSRARARSALDPAPPRVTAARRRNVRRRRPSSATARAERRARTERTAHAKRGTERTARAEQDADAPPERSARAEDDLRERPGAHDRGRP